MPEPLKNRFNGALIAQLGAHLARHAHATEFDEESFVAKATTGLEALELKARSLHIGRALSANLPRDFSRACAIIQAALHPHEQAPLAEQTMDEHGIRGWAVMPLADFVADCGLRHFDISMQLLAQLSKRFTAEFAVRTFIIHDLHHALKYLQAWARHDNEHLRRLASEGSRPRLPWAVQIPSLIANPTAVLPVLELLKDDPSEYVRKSVANHLNDVAKDHPALVVDIASRWLAGASPARQRLVRHACRTLIKQGHPDILQLFGVGTAFDGNVDLQLAEQQLHLGEALDLVATMVSSSSKRQELLLDYVVHFRLASGGSSKKVFKWRRVTLAAGETICLRKKHRLRPITTRTFYAGAHRVQLQINGQSMAEQDFELHL